MKTILDFFCLKLIVTKLSMNDKLVGVVACKTLTGWRMSAVPPASTNNETDTLDVGRATEIISEAIPQQPAAWLSPLLAVQLSTLLANSSLPVLKLCTVLSLL